MAPETTTYDQDLKAIARLHERDMEASRNGDFETLRSLMSEHAVLMPPGEHWLRGAEALDENYERMAKAMQDIEVTAYTLAFEEIEVLGDYAFEWGTIQGSTRSKQDNPAEPSESSSYKVLRILKKEPARGWRVHRAIWNANPTEGSSVGSAAADRKAEEAVSETLSAWAVAIRTADLDAIARLVTEDAEFWTHGEPPLQGRAALRQAFEPFFTEYDMQQDFQIEELIVEGDHAFIRGLEVNQLTPRDGGERIEVRQRAFSVLRRDADGSWRFARGMTNWPPEEASP